MAARELLRRGIGWLIGDETQIILWSDAWLSPSSHTRPFGPPTEATKAWKVSNMFYLISSKWNMDVVRQILPHHEEEILKLTLIFLVSPVRLTWLLSTGGEYTTKTGYANSKIHL